MTDYAVRCSHTARPIFGAVEKEREFVTHQVVSADSVEAAARYAISRSSVAAIMAGLTVTVATFEWDGAARFHASYDGEPLTDSHARTAAELVVARLSDPGVEKNSTREPSA